VADQVEVADRRPGLLTHYSAQCIHRPKVLAQDFPKNTDVIGENMAIVAAIGAAAEVAKAAEQVYRLLDGSRSCVITVKNHTDQRLEIAAEQPESGGYKTPPDQFVDSQTAQIFGHQDNGFMTGSIGRIYYKIGPFEEYFEIRWANPFIGANLASAGAWNYNEQWTFKESENYRSYARSGSGEVGAEMLFELYRR